MLNLLLGTKKLEDLRIFANTISRGTQNIKITYLVTSGMQALNNINSDDNINIAILDYDLCGMKIFLTNISDNRKENLKKSIIVLTNNYEKHQNLLNNYYVHDVISKNDTESLIVGSLNRYLRNYYPLYFENEDKNKIIAELQRIGYNLSHIGTHYLIETLFLIRSNKYSAQNLSKIVYPLISEKYNKPLNNIKCNITLATDAVYKNVNNINLQNYFKLSGKIKPTTKMVIYTVLQRLREA